jgi:hypothetical protein
MGGESRTKRVNEIKEEFAKVIKKNANIELWQDEKMEHIIRDYKPDLKLRGFKTIQPYHLLVITEDGEESISYTNAIRKHVGLKVTESSPMTLLTKACRLSIHDLSRATVMNSTRSCKKCGSIEKLECDHHPLSFDEILKDYIAITPSFESTEIVKTNLWFHDFADSKAKAGWIAYHESRVKWQVLCKKCHGSKVNDKGCGRD